MLYLLYRAGRFIALSLPVKIAYWIADILSNLYYLLAKNDRKIATGNIRVVLEYTDSALNPGQTSRKVFKNFARYLVEFFRTPKVDLKYIKKYIKIEGKENLDAALRLGRGVLLVSAHLGNWELGAMTLSMLGYKVNTVAWTHRDRFVNDFFLQQRQSKGAMVIPLGTTIRRVFTVLKNNEAVALLGDIDYNNPKRGIRVKFFGKDTPMPKGPAVFSLKTGAPIVPGFMLREKGYRFRLVLEDPILYRVTGNRESDLVNITQRLAEIIESYIARYPGQWFMLTPRW